MIPETIHNHPVVDTDQCQFTCITECFITEKMELLSGISHELRTPVSILKSNIQLLKDSNFSLNKEIKEECITLCSDSIESLTGFLDSIQLISRSLRYGLTAKISFFRVKQVSCKLFFNLSKQNLDFKRLKITWELETTMISSDLNYLRQIILNLCTNALKYSQEKVSLRVQTNHNDLIIVIQDWGIGIPQEDIRLIFNPFYRSKNTTKIPGAGLGLAEVKALTDCMNGKIYVSSELLNGTIIKIVMPHGLSI